MNVRVEITESPLNSESVWAEIADESCGAHNIFVGVTRNHHDGKGVSGLEYHCYPDMAEKELLRVAQESARTHGITNMVVLHRIGRVDIGEASLVVAAASAHRHQALEGTHDFINRLKKDVPIWKKESFEDGSKGWVEGNDIRDTN